MTPKTKRQHSLVLAICGGLIPVGSVSAESGRVLWDNGEPDGSGGYSNGTAGVVGCRRTLLDDFAVPIAETWAITSFSSFHIWNTLPPGSGTGFEICLRLDADGLPGEVLQVINVESYQEVATGRAFFCRLEYRQWSTFEPVMLGPGRYWIDATTVGPENNFWLTRIPIRGTECWVDYECQGGLQSGFEFFGQPLDLSWLLSGTATCRPDFDDNGEVDFGDLLDLLSAWGPCEHPSDCPEDLDNDGEVGLSDLLILLAAWGPCP